LEEKNDEENAGIAIDKMKTCCVYSLQHKTPSKNNEEMDPQPLSRSPVILVISGMKTPSLQPLSLLHPSPQHTGSEQPPSIEQSSAMLSYSQIPAAEQWLMAAA
jgi:hypothetical protein